MYRRVAKAAIETVTEVEQESINLFGVDQVKNIGQKVTQSASAHVTADWVNESDSTACGEVDATLSDIFGNESSTSPCRGVRGNIQSEYDCRLDSAELRKSLQEWAVSHTVTQSAVTALLHILVPYHPELPRNVRILVKTPLSLTTKELDNGAYCHFGIELGLLHFLECKYMMQDCIKLAFNVDGLPIYRSSNTQFWPILAKVQNIAGDHVFVVGIFLQYCGQVSVFPFFTLTLCCFYFGVKGMGWSLLWKRSGNVTDICRALPQLVWFRIFSV